jgi:hypothetical protein
VEERARWNEYRYAKIANCNVRVSADANVSADAMGMGTTLLQ